jgi:hypothetical protein
VYLPVSTAQYSCFQYSAILSFTCPHPHIRPSVHFLNKFLSFYYVAEVQRKASNPTSRSDDNNRLQVQSMSRLLLRNLWRSQCPFRLVFFTHGIVTLASDHVHLRNFKSAFGGGRGSTTNHPIPTSIWIKLYIERAWPVAATQQCSVDNDHHPNL